MTAMIRRLSNERYQPRPDYFNEGDAHYAINQRVLASLVGVIAFALPWTLLWAPKQFGLCFRDSISHFYYAPFLGIVLVAALSAIATFLIAYRGQNRWENGLATLAGLAALGVALFPVTGHGCADQGPFRARAIVSLPGQASGGSSVDPGGAVALFELFPQVGTLHYLSAAVLFGFLGWYCFRVFPRVVIARQTRDGGARLTRAKTTRNAIYFASGAVIVLAAAAMGINSLAGGLFGASGAWWTAHNMTFWCEAAALWAFGLSWTVKGRLFGLVLKDRGE